MLISAGKMDWFVDLQAAHDIVLASLTARLHEVTRNRAGVTQSEQSGITVRWHAAQAVGEILPCHLFQREENVVLWGEECNRRLLLLTFASLQAAIEAHRRICAFELHPQRVALLMHYVAVFIRFARFQ
jgi:hypothetical protein